MINKVAGISWKMSHCRNPLQAKPNSTSFVNHGVFHGGNLQWTCQWVQCLRFPPSATSLASVMQLWKFRERRQRGEKSRWKQGSYFWRMLLHPRRKQFLGTCALPGTTLTLPPRRALHEVGPLAQSQRHCSQIPEASTSPAQTVLVGRVPGKHQDIWTYFYKPDYYHQGWRQYSRISEDVCHSPQAWLPPTKVEEASVTRIPVVPTLPFVKQSHQIYLTHRCCVHRWTRPKSFTLKSL